MPNACPNRPVKLVTPSLALCRGIKALAFLSALLFALALAAGCGSGASDGGDGPAEGGGGDVSARPSGGAGTEGGEGAGEGTGGGEGSGAGGERGEGAGAAQGAAAGSVHGGTDGDGGGAVIPSPPPASGSPSDLGAAAAQSAPLPGADEPLEVLQIIPGGQVRSFTQAAVMFNQPMARLGTFDEADQGLLAIDPPLPGKVVWVNQFTLAFVPDKPLLGSFAGKVVLSPGIKSLSGAGLKPGSYESGFALPSVEVEWQYSDAGTEPAAALRPSVDVM
ncbi:MAG: hypothetical protein LBQ12_01510, partial [Deltaproteobacteria bacterium]|nr:hypothetical protein [Deltaproteobacteria bacterium]